MVVAVHLLRFPALGPHSGPLSAEWTEIEFVQQNNHLLQLFQVYSRFHECEPWSCGGCTKIGPFLLQFSTPSWRTSGTLSAVMCHTPESTTENGKLECSNA